MIVTLAVFIFFISKKMNQIPRPVELKAEDGAVIEQSGMKDAVKHKVSHFFLHMLEKMTKRFKLMSLKSHNALETWSKKIREKKEDRLRAREELKQQQDAAIAELELKEEDDTKKPKDILAEIAKPEVAQKVKKETVMPPMVREEVAIPEPKEEEKGEYESALIERIAMNPRDIEAYERLGDYYVELGNSIDAVECFKQVVKLSPGNRKAKLAIRKLDKKKV